MEGFNDWDTAYAADPTAQHYREALWAGLFTYCPIGHWKLDYMRGAGAYSNGGAKFWVFGPPSSFIKNESLIGLVPETAYAVPDPLNPVPQVKCLGVGTANPNPKVMVMALKGTDKVFLYVKNLTNTWAGIVDSFEKNYQIAPIPETGLSATIRVEGLVPGVYTLESWSTTDPDISTQKLSTSGIVVGVDGVAAFDVTGLNSALAFKVKRNNQ